MIKFWIAIYFILYFLFYFIFDDFFHDFFYEVLKFPDISRLLQHKQHVQIYKWIN